jgi:hypothetical protein
MSSQTKRRRNSTSNIPSSNKKPIEETKRIEEDFKANDSKEYNFIWMQNLAWILLALVLISTTAVIIKPDLHQRWKSWRFNKTKEASQNVSEETNERKEANTINEKKIVTDDELSPHAPRFVMFFRPNCGGCQYAKPIVIDYAENRSPPGFKLIMRDCTEPCQRQECSKAVKVPKFYYQRNASDSGEFLDLHNTRFTEEKFDAFVREKMNIGLANPQNNTERKLNANVSGDWSNGYYS